MLWLPTAAAIGTVLVLFGRSGWSVGLAVALLVGLFAQLILTVLLHVVPLLRRRGAASRGALIARTERFPRTRTAVLNLGVLLVLVADLTPGLPVGFERAAGRGGWALVIVAVTAHLAIMLWPLGRRSRPGWPR